MIVIMSPHVYAPKLSMIFDTNPMTKPLRFFSWCIEQNVTCEWPFTFRSFKYSADCTIVLNWNRLSQMLGNCSKWCHSLKLIMHIWGRPFQHTNVKYLKQKKKDFLIVSPLLNKVSVIKLCQNRTWETWLLSHARVVWFRIFNRTSKAIWQLQSSIAVAASSVSWLCGC